MTMDSLMNRDLNAATMRPATLPEEFAYDTEHPVVPVPFTAHLGDKRVKGAGLSAVAAYVEVPGPVDPSILGRQLPVRLQFDFDGFTINLFPVARIAQSRENQLILQFLDPTGPHLPQLRYILNSYIAGDFISLGAMLGYSGPTRPKNPPVEDGRRFGRFVKRTLTLALSLSLIGVAALAIHQRYTQSYEPRPVFIMRDGHDMRATSAGQLTFLNPQARAGDVVFTIAANSGDVLNVTLPCDCEVNVSDGVYEGATVLPSDPILSFFPSNIDVRVQTQMSIEGIAKAMGGEDVFLDFEDGRSVAVEVMLNSASNAAAARGDLYLPVVLLAVEDELGAEDIGKPARVRLTRSLLDGSFMGQKES
ncbi:MAG: hypothetical protein AAGA19_01350 [Pseudomonadota bacterium]